MSDKRLIKLGEAVKVQQCVDSIAASVGELTKNTFQLAKVIKEYLPDSAPKPTAKLLQVDKVAKKLDCCRATVYNLIKSGDLDCIYLGKRGIRITEDSLSYYIAKNRVLPDEFMI
jgi:predicted DNA-binding transcriptional regulator AlpA